ncbi:MAG: formate-dependent phosphoribosylglycinamide formyltransferase [Deltaproteobacteria bacterium]|nr:MAG: formate-dependent phosphoribosylglycinamide formyltransferase [Deltaproteobacteria bacterium]
MTVSWGTPGTPDAARLMLLGSGELGREVAIEAMRLGVEVIACDRYAGAPAMQVAHRAIVFDMQDPALLRRHVEATRPTWIVPEIEALATSELVALEQEGWSVVPTARAAQLTMDREGIRRLAAEELGLATSPYRFAESAAEARDAIDTVGLPCVIKPVMSSSGKGQSTIHHLVDAEAAFARACAGSRGRSARVIVEGFVQFDTEITLLTIRSSTEGVVCCPPIGHRQEQGDYVLSWQPQPLPEKVLPAAVEMATAVVDALGGYGLFGVELFIRGDEVIFSEVSPRPHDTGMVTMISQDRSEFELHVRAILGLPIGEIHCPRPAASAVIRSSAHGGAPRYAGMERACAVPTAQVRLFGKPDTRPGRRLGVALATGSSLEEACSRAEAAAACVEVIQD